MSATALSVLLGLRGASPLEPPPSYGALYMCSHFLFAFAILTSRPWKIYYRLDHQVCPRQDLDKYGPRAVSSGKITQKKLDQIRRVEAAHANSMEHFAFFAAAIIWAHVAGVATDVINARALEYTIARLTYCLVYITVSSYRLSLLRALAWWASTIICLRLTLAGGRSINSTLVGI